MSCDHPYAWIKSNKKKAECASCGKEVDAKDYFIHSGGQGMPSRKKKEAAQ